MKYNKINIEKIIIALLLFLCVIVAIIFLMGIEKYKEKDLESINGSTGNPSQSSEQIVDVQKIISNIKNKFVNLEYESSNIKEFTSLVFKENEKYKSFIIDTLTGKELEFNDLIKEDKLELFKNKELELLNLKYPEFIVKGLMESDVTKFYYVKDNEVIIFYYDYILEYEYAEILSLRIDYNEISDYLNFTPNLNDTYELENGFNYSKDKKAVAITFDDGPSRTYNSKILEELAKNKAHATFFMVGNMMYSCQKCVLDTYNSGNEIGSHTYEHINIKNKSISIVNESLTKTNDIYYKITNDNLKLLRPPYGAYNKTNLENINNSFVLWNIDTEDWRYRDIERIANHVMENVSDGSIILMHELYETSYEALKIILPKLYAEGYQVVSVSELALLKDRTLEVGKTYRFIK